MSPEPVGVTLTLTSPPGKQRELVLQSLVDLALIHTVPTLCQQLPLPL